ncbi:MAG: hypothetical protein PHY92_05345 [Alphaproteobacteria bacterium]|nr:hypothetical protein [Alphaproteobacteria bacterium]
MNTQMVKEAIIVKIGTSALSLPDGRPDIKVLRSLCRQIAKLKAEGHHVILVTSGAVGIGRAIAKERGISFDGLDETLIKQICSGLGQPVLMSLYDRLLAKHGISVPQILPTKSDFGVNGGSEGQASVFPDKLDPDFVKPLLASMQHDNLLPIVNENDMVSAREIKFTDNDELAGLLAKLVKADRMIILSNVEGVYKKPGEAEVIPVFNLTDPNTWPQSVKGTSPSGIGGMESKVRVAETLMDQGTAFYIASSRKKNALPNIMREKRVGTEIICQRPKNAPRIQFAYSPA